MGEDLVGIPISDFITGKVIPVDVYLKLSDSKFVQIANAGEEIHLDRLKSYQAKEVDELFVRKEDYSKFVERGIKIAGILLKHKELSAPQKAKVLTQAAKSVFSSFESSKISKESYEHAKQVTAMTIRLVESKPDILHLMNALSEVDDAVTAHAVAVSAVSVMIGKKLEWVNPATIEKLALGGMLVDVGLKEIQPAIATKKRIHLSHSERQIFETHPFRGAMILQSLNIVPDDIVSIVYEHHENAIGQGFPRRLKDLVMHPLAKVVSLANAFCELTFKANSEEKPKTAEEAVTYIEHTLGQPYNKEAFKALRELVLTAEKSAA